MARHILIVDDDSLLRRSLAFNLENAGFQTSTAANAEDAVQMARLNRPDLVLLDINLPGMDGLQALKIFKEELKIGVIFLTARRRELDEVLGLELGGDDYITKPFDTDVLIAHIKAVLRRLEPTKSSEPEKTSLRVGDLMLDETSHIVKLKEKPVELSPREFDVLKVLMSQPGKVFSVDELLNLVWGAEFVGQPQVVYVHIRWLREKLEQDPDHPQRIITVRGVGYKIQGSLT
ncbi:MAG: winged helix-turn-helix domain-containing protein [Anaerolineales bacterium]